MPWSDKRESTPLVLRAARQAAILVLAAVVPAILTGGLHPRRPVWPGSGGDIREISVMDAWMLARTNPVIWADARSGQAFAAQHVPGAINVTEADWERSLGGFVEVWRPGWPVVVYCASDSCETSRSVAARLRRELRLTEVYVLKGGWEEWQRRQR